MNRYHLKINKLKLKLYKNGFILNDGEFRNIKDPINKKFMEDVEKEKKDKEEREKKEKEKEIKEKQKERKKSDDIKQNIWINKWYW